MLHNFDVERLEIEGLLLLTPRRFGDERGFFSETFKDVLFEALDLPIRFVQDNHSYSAERGVLRGLHLQRPPFAQDKLVRCTRGRILDVAVDLRVGSPTYGRHVGVELSAENWRQLLVPIGFAHGFLTLTPDAEVMYKVSAPYSAASEDGIAWDDPDLAIDWPLEGRAPILSEKDKVLGALRDFTSPFASERAP